MNWRVWRRDAAYCFTLDLKDDPQLIAEYKRHHQRVWPDIIQSLTSSGIAELQIYLLETRMFMIMDVDEHFSLAAKAEADCANPKVREWEELMWNYQQALPQANARRKWLLMEQVFSLQSASNTNEAADKGESFPVQVSAEVNTLFRLQLLSKLDRRWRAALGRF